MRRESVAGEMPVCVRFRTHRTRFSAAAPNIIERPTLNVGQTGFYEFYTQQNIRYFRRRLPSFRRGAEARPQRLSRGEEVRRQRLFLLCLHTVVFRGRILRHGERAVSPGANGRRAVLLAAACEGGVRRERRTSRRGTACGRVFRVLHGRIRDGGSTFTRLPISSRSPASVTTPSATTSPNSPKTIPRPWRG